MVKAANKRQPPPRQPRVTRVRVVRFWAHFRTLAAHELIPCRHLLRGICCLLAQRSSGILAPAALQVWDRLEIKLPDRAIERDIRIVQQRALALSSGHISLHGSQDTSSMDSDSSLPHAAGYHHHAGRRGPARSRAGSEQPTGTATEAAAAYPTSARGAADPRAAEHAAKQEQQQRFAGSVANQWRSRSASPFQFPPAPATTVAYHLQVRRGGCSRKIILLVVFKPSWYGVGSYKRY